MAQRFEASIFFALARLEINMITLHIPHFSILGEDKHYYYRQLLQNVWYKDTIIMYI